MLSFLKKGFFGDCLLRESSHTHSLWFPIFSILLVVFFSGIFLTFFPFLALSQSPEEGKQVFENKCTTCHTIGGGDIAGPDLKGVAKRRERKWLEAFISAPDKMLAEKDPIALELFGKYNFAMPNLSLTEEEVSALIAFFEAESGLLKKAPTEAPATTIPTAPPASALVGDALEGWKLFYGAKKFQNGGPACIGCHGAGKRGTFGGGTLGPDLTKAYSKFGKDGIVTILSTLPFPTMRPIFAQKMITPQEQAHLRAFFEQVDSQSPEMMTPGVFLISFAGFAFMFLAAGFIWRSRSFGVRAPLLRGSKKRSR